MATARERLEARAGKPVQPTDPDDLLSLTFRPRGWARMTREERLDWIATRIIADDRDGSGVTSHRVLRESGILSAHQLDRRRRREVYSNFLTHGGLDQEGVALVPGVFGRAHVARRSRGGEQPRRPWEDWKDDHRGSQGSWRYP